MTGEREAEGSQHRVDGKRILGRARVKFRRIENMVPMGRGMERFGPALFAKSNNHSNSARISVPELCGQKKAGSPFKTSPLWNSYKC